MTSLATNPYLEGNHAPVHEVTATTSDLSVTGTIPVELNGRFLRNGPNPAGHPDPATYHWFTGDGMVHGIRLNEGRAEWYRNRWVRSADVTRLLGETPKEPHDDLNAVAVHAGMDFAANTNVIGHNGRIFAIVEAGARPYELTQELDTIGRCDFDGTLEGGYTAHPKRDSKTNELYAVSYFFGWGNDVEVTTIDTNARVRNARRITLGGPTMIHDTAITHSRIVLFDLPVLFDMEMAVAGARLPYRWFDDYPARVGLLPRDGDSTDVVWHEVDPCYIFHPMNAYDLDPDDPNGGVVVDVARHPSMFRTELLGPNEGPPTLERWHLDGHGAAVKEERLDDRGQEFPRIDERHTGLPHRYGFSVTINTDADTNILGSESGLIRHDLTSGTSEIRQFGRGTTIGEGVFVPRSDAAAEGDGWVLVLAHEGATDMSSLHIINAEDLGGTPQAVIELPQRVPVGFHGNWIPDAI
jgi:carotenoid cleavage dioxygenase